MGVRGPFAKQHRTRGTMLKIKARMQPARNPLTLGISQVLNSSAWVLVEFHSGAKAQCTQICKFIDCFLMRAGGSKFSRIDLSNTKNVC